ncbi:MAG: DnaJ domain-containing protein [Candidatus Kariarchaeaceae archaeon]|jgi:DnaJ-class molecular chaperone
MTDYYNVLGVARSASASQIKKAYRSLAKQYHPDQAKMDLKEAEEKFKKINEAYSILSDPRKKQQYDRFGTVSDHSFGGMQYTTFNGGSNGVSKRKTIEQRLSKKQNFDYLQFAAELGVHPSNLLKILTKLIERLSLNVQIIETTVRFK